MLIRSGRCRLAMSVVAAAAGLGSAGLTGALAQAPAGGPGAAQSSRELLNLGFASTPEGLREAVATGTPATIIAALKAATDLGSDALKDRAMGMLRSSNFAIQLAAAKYLGRIGVPEGAQLVRNFGEAPREYVLDDHNLQLLVIDAAREVAQHGHVDYAFQLPLLIEQGDWTVKTFAVLALRDFRAPQDAVVEDAWLRAVAVYRDAIAIDDANVQKAAVEFMRTAIDSALLLDATSAKVRDEFNKLAAEGAPAHVPGAASLDFKGAAAHLNGCEIRNPRDEAPKLDPGPRVIAQSATEHLLMNIDKGNVTTFETDLDNRGVFEGLSKQEWIKKIEREHAVPMDDVEKRILTRSVRTSQPSSYEVRVEIRGDQYDPATRRWKPTIFRSTVTWWGYGWHFSSFNRIPDVQSLPDIESIPAPAPDDRYPEAQLAASALVKAMSDMDVDALANLLADDVRIQQDTLTKAQFVEEMHRLFGEMRGQVVFRPVSYAFTPGDDPSRITAKIESRSYNRVHNRMLQVWYTIDLERRGDDWKIVRLDSDIKKLDP